LEITKITDDKIKYKVPGASYESTSYWPTLEGVGVKINADGTLSINPYNNKYSAKEPVKIYWPKNTKPEIKPIVKSKPKSKVEKKAKPKSIEQKWKINLKKNKTYEILDDSFLTLSKTMMSFNKKWGNLQISTLPTRANKNLPLDYAQIYNPGITEILKPGQSITIGRNYRNNYFGFNNTVSWNHWVLTYWKDGKIYYKDTSSNWSTVDWKVKS